MHFNMLVNFVLTILLAVGSVEGYCKQSWRNENCCYRNQGAIDRQSHHPKGSFCDEKVLATCNADCCNFQGKGIKCPKGKEPKEGQML